MAYSASLTEAYRLAGGYGARILGQGPLGRDIQRGNRYLRAADSRSPAPHGRSTRTLRTSYPGSYATPGI